MTSAPARAWFSDWRTSAFDRLVVEDADFAALMFVHEAVMAVAGVGIERHVGDQP